MFGGDPDVSVGPEGKGAELDDGGMCGGDGIADWERGGVEDADIAA